MYKALSVRGASKGQIINIVRRALGYIDERLVNHGERVAYIAARIADLAEETGRSLGLDHEKLLVLCLLHDIGAYKTEEIDNMVEFETTDVLSHAVYGYVFLRNFSPLGEDSKAILYHHSSCVELETLEPSIRKAAELIFLTDRADILLAEAEAGETDWEALRRLSGTVFSRELVELFLEAEERYDISGHIRDGSYYELVDARLQALSLTDAEIMGYLRMLVYSIDFRSPFTVTHTANTVTICTLLAERLDIAGDDMSDLVLGAFLHDIGKIAIPFAILEKPGKLTTEQMNIMRTHVEISERILSGTVSDKICAIAVRHHEKLNGTGYHKGLTADELTVSERIVAVADIISALRSRRSYKEAFSREQTRSIIMGMRERGELCPSVCAVLFENYDELMDAVDTADDPVIALYEKINCQYREYYALLSGREPPEQ